MTKVHRRLLARHDDIRAVNLDSPYGFQENVEQVTDKLVEYFATSLSTRLRSLALPSFEGADTLQRDIVKHEVRRANYVFAGPGSPSYALQQWRPLELVEDLRAVLDADGTLCFSSAAVLTLGSHTAPVYEIYKVGATPTWLEGLDLLGDLGLPCAAIPHFDNAEGRNYDTRFCYLGERRLQQLEEQLPPHVGVLGIDEHSALVIDIADDTATVSGRSDVHWRHHGETLVLKNGSTTPLGVLRAFSGSTATIRTRAALNAPQIPDDLLAQFAEPAFDPTPLIQGVLTLRDEAKRASDYALADRLRSVLTDAGIAIHDEPQGRTSWEILR